MPSLRDVKRRITSIKNTAKVTHALEAVSATKMRRWQERALNARPFAAKALALLSYLKSTSHKHYPTLGKKSPNPKAPEVILVISSDKGLCGGHNIRLLVYVEKALEDIDNAKKIIALGKYGRDYLKRRDYDILLEEVGFGEHITRERVKEMYEFLEEGFLKGVFSKVLVAYTEFITTLRQEPRIRQLLPVNENDLAQIVQNIIPRSGRYSETNSQPLIANPQKFSYIFEPSIEAIMPSLVKELTQVALFHMVLEANASEHSARMLAMKNATDNANDILGTLGLQYNKARQGEITKGVLEVASGSQALS